MRVVTWTCDWPPCKNRAVIDNDSVTPRGWVKDTTYEFCSELHGRLYHKAHQVVAHRIDSERQAFFDAAVHVLRREDPDDDQT